MPAEFLVTEFGLETTAQGAVIATSPARQPLTIIDKSGLPLMIFAVTIAPIIPAHEASAVVNAMRGTFKSSAS